MFFAGWSCTILILPFMSDKIGRRWIFAFSMMLVAVVMTGLFISTNINLTIALMFMAGALTSGRTMVGYVYINEFLTPAWQVVFGTSFLMIDGTTYLWMTFYFDFLNKHYMFFSSVGLLLTCVGTVGTLYFMPESPLWALKAGKTD
jgi:MFS family permease